MTSLVELIEQVSATFDAADIDHAFGGALALAYVTEPRGTVDIDVNVFLDAAATEPVEAALETIEFQ